MNGASRDAEYSNRSDSPFEQGPNTFSSQEIEEMYGQKNYQYILAPRIALTFKFTNTANQPIVVTIAEVNSLLGNFAPRPEKLTLAPGQESSIDPMLSTFDDNFEDLDLTLTIRSGGQSETHVLKLRREQPLPPTGSEKPGSS